MLSLNGLLTGSDSPELGYSPLPATVVEMEMKSLERVRLK